MTPDSEWCSCTKDTTNAIVEASNYSLSIIVVVCAALFYKETMISFISFNRRSVLPTILIGIINSSD